MSTDLGLIDSDRSDSLSINSSNNTNSDHDNSDTAEISPGNGAEDWSKFGSLWSDSHQSFGKPYNDFMDLSDFPSMSMSVSMDSDMTMGMDYSYSSTMGVDPTSLHFNPAAAGLALGFGYSDTTYADSYTPSVGYTFQQQQPLHLQTALAPVSTQGSTSPQPFTKERRLSVTSSSSSSVSGASLSPMLDKYHVSPPSSRSGYSSDTVPTKEEPNPIAESANLNQYSNDPAAELAHRVRQSAGVMHALPVHGFSVPFQGANVLEGKLPIPRLNRPSTTTPSYAKSIAAAPLSSSSSVSSAASTPPPSTPPSTSHSPLNMSTSNSVGSVNVPPAASMVRPKTSHTTIERRYRTNLNARIQSLRMAVPALRVLEDREGSNGKKIKKNIKGGVIVKGGGIGIGVESAEDGSIVDVIDERGFVDGVKVARKCSKANVLGKAVEYIRVLKRRERRLKAELAGVKALVQGLVGGPALIREWENQWRARFGGEEKDEVEGEDEEGEGEGEDDESEDDDGEEGDEEGGRKRKRAKVLNPPSSKVDSKKEKKPASSPIVVLAGEQNGNPLPEKRKRGRPRKILPPPVTLEPVANANAPAPALLPAAVIVQRDGLGSAKRDEVMQALQYETRPGQWQQQQQQQQQSPPQRYLLAVFALFSFFNSPLTSSSSMGHYSSQSHHHHTGRVLTPPLAYSPEIVSQFVQPPTAPSVSAPVWKEYVQLFHLFVSLLVLASFVGNWFGFGISEFRFEKRGWGWRLIRKGKDEKGDEDWIRFAEERVLSGKARSLSYFKQFQIYRAISDRRVNASVGNLVSAAIALNNAGGALFGRLARMKARKFWEEGRQKVQGSKTNSSRKIGIKEEMVFESMDLDGACERLGGMRLVVDETDEEREYDLLEMLACGIVNERVKEHLGWMFVDFVSAREDEDGDEMEEEEERGKLEEEERRRKTVDASRELGGSVEELGRLFERMWKIGVGGVDLEDIESVFSDMCSPGGLDEETRSLFVALVLYARLFGDGATETSEETETERSSSLLSPPPSPTPRAWTEKGMTGRASGLLVMSKAKSGKRAKMMSELRGVLGSRVFEDSVGGVSERDEVWKKGVEGLEEARDRVVDLIVNFERRER